jgi:hypothetical protein
MAFALALAVAGWAVSALFASVAYGFYLPTLAGIGCSVDRLSRRQDSCDRPATSVLRAPNPRAAARKA